ncbi:ABC1 kinase family protein [Planctomonas psychrotolerans]|uniref:ABC1 kinase family protein n=1 Tax=Planctomonas psychrotolerans TaxID=2528712 RepID=UPI00123888CC|nr:AarF/ABC1/UbiB kinase family protein [Planctomonas psychrotolerans]
MQPTNNVDRYRQIGTVLARHGLGTLADALGIGNWLPGPLRIRGGTVRGHLTNAQRFRLALEDLGPTFIKLGQVLSTRSDLLPPDYLTELSKLQSNAVPIDSATVLQVIAEELGAPVDELFASFDREPLASASIGQAHAAVTLNGTAVVVKVRRPGAVSLINQDLEILQNLAAQASRRSELAHRYDVVGLASEFAHTLRAELDYLQEGRNAERFAEDFRTTDSLHIPRVFWDTTTSRVLTLERITGTRVDDVEALDAQGANRTAIVTLAVDLIAEMVFTHGFFHADPHPGNLFVESDRRIGLIDFGMVGEIDDDLRAGISKLFVALASNDADRIGFALIGLSVTRVTPDRDGLRSDLVRFMALYRGRELGEVRIGPLVTRAFGILRDHHIQLQPQVILLLRMLLMVEGLGVRLDPQFSLGTALEPYARRMAEERFSPAQMAKRAAKASLAAAELSIELPDKLRRIFDLIDTNGVEVHLRAAELDPIVGRVERIGHRLVAGMIASAFIRGVGELASHSSGRNRMWVVPLFRVGFGAATALSGYLAWTARPKLGRRGR